MRLPVSLTVVGPALMVGAAACGGSGYQYVQNDDLGIYAKLPDDWAVYDEDDLFPGASERELDAQQDQGWVRTFDAADDPSVEGSQEFGGDHPSGLVSFRNLSPQEREDLNLSALRGGGDPRFDPVAAAETDTEGIVTVLRDEPIEFDGGYTGVHTVYAVREGGKSDGMIIVIDQTAVRNADTTAIALFQVNCSENCYFDTHKDEIADLVDSWTIQEVQE